MTSRPPRGFTPGRCAVPFTRDSTHARVPMRYSRGDQRHHPGASRAEFSGLSDLGGDARYALSADRRRADAQLSVPPSPGQTAHRLATYLSTASVAGQPRGSGSFLRVDLEREPPFSHAQSKAMDPAQVPGLPILISSLALLVGA